MNVVGDRAFNMYLNAETEKPSDPLLNRYHIATAILRDVLCSSSHKCFCSDTSSKAIPAPVEEKHVTEILVSSLNISSAEHILSLTQNYIVEGLSLSELTLKSFFAFLANTPKCAAEKLRIQAALNEQLRLHPSCAAHMVQRYRHLMLIRDDEFAGLSVTEYVVSKLEQLVSVDNDVRISNNRTSRRRRRPTRMADESPIKRPKKVEVFVDTDEDEVNGGEAGSSSEQQQPEIQNLLTLLQHLTHILRHDLGYMLKREEPVRSCILGQLMFDGADPANGVTTLNHSFVTRICEVLKNTEKLPIIHGICELLQLVGDVCALQQAENDPNGAYNTELPGPCRILINELCTSVIGEKLLPSKVFPVMLNLGPVWLRYHAIHYLVEKVFCRKVPTGLEGIANLFGAIHRSIRERILDTSKILKLVSSNQRTYPEVVPIDGKKSVKSESNSYAGHGAVSKHSSAKSEMKSEIDSAGDEEKSVDFSVRQKLTPYMCHLLFLLIDSTITIIKLTGTIDHSKTNEDSSNLKNILNELCGEKNIPIELNLLRRRLNKIL